MLYGVFQLVAKRYFAIGKAEGCLILFVVVLFRDDEEISYGHFICSFLSLTFLHVLSGPSE